MVLLAGGCGWDASFSWYDSSIEVGLHEAEQGHEVILVDCLGGPLDFVTVATSTAPADDGLVAWSIEMTDPAAAIDAGPEAVHLPIGAVPPGYRAATSADALDAAIAASDYVIVTWGHPRTLTGASP